jgi:hypothetical protein
MVVFSLLVVIGSAAFSSPRHTIGNYGGVSIEIDSRK